jgi:hypothetical protein
MSSAQSEWSVLKRIKFHMLVTDGSTMDTSLLVYNLCPFKIQNEWLVWLEVIFICLLCVVYSEWHTLVSLFNLTFWWCPLFILTHTYTHTHTTHSHIQSTYTTSLITFSMSIKQISLFPFNDSLKQPFAFIWTGLVRNGEWSTICSYWSGGYPCKIPATPLYVM